MRIENFEKGVVFSDRERQLLARKLGKMATYCRRLKDASSVIRLETERRATKKASDGVKVMLTVELPKKVLRAESRKETVTEAVDRCVEKLEPQLLKYKELHTKKGRARKARMKNRSTRAS